jgi:hypothetical protein
MRVPGASIVAAAALALVSLVSAAPARADDVTEKAALLHLERGVAAFKAGDYLRAHRELEAAHDLAPDRANPYRWLALTEIQLGDCQRALVNIEGFLSRVKPDEPRVAELVRLRELCQRTGVLRVDSTPVRVTLHLDGAYVGTTPFHARSLQSGSHTLRAEARGHRAAHQTVELPAGGTLDVHLRLAPQRRPVHRRWWFWTAVAGAAAVATTAIVLAGGDDTPTVLPPILCDPAGCRP